MKCEGLYLLPFGPLRTVFSAKDLDKWVDLMIEKGLRLRKELDPYLVGWKEEKDAGESAGNSEELDEIEERAIEHRKLLPYN